MPVSYPAHVSLTDKAVKTSVSSLNFANADAVTYVTDGSGPVDDWITAAAAMSLATVTSKGVAREVTPVSPVLPTDDDAYNSAKLTIFYHDTTNGKKFRYSIGARDKSKFNTAPRSKNVILTVAGGGTTQTEALVTATEAGVSPDGGDILVDAIVISGGKQ